MDGNQDNRQSTQATDNRRRGAGEHGIAASALANLDNLRVLVFIRARISVLMVKGALVKMTQPLRTARGATRTRTESERLDITPDGQLSSSGARHHADATRAWKVALADLATHYTELLKYSSYKLPPRFSDSEGVCA